MGESGEVSPGNVQHFLLAVAAHSLRPGHLANGREGKELEDQGIDGKRHLEKVFIDRLNPALNNQNPAQCE